MLISSISIRTIAQAVHFQASSAALRGAGRGLSAFGFCTSGAATQNIRLPFAFDLCALLPHEPLPEANVEVLRRAKDERVRGRPQCRPRVAALPDAEGKCSALAHRTTRAFGALPVTHADATCWRPCLEMLAEFLARLGTSGELQARGERFEEAEDDVNANYRCALLRALDMCLAELDAHNSWRERPHLRDALTASLAALSSRWCGERLCVQSGRVCLRHGAQWPHGLGNATLMLHVLGQSSAGMRRDVTSILKALRFGNVNTVI